ncbi:MAG: hypothetical protein LBB05_01395 [Puniceicoccales bacterium]|jgi:beta-lactamase superfamily II metal-dependent hydrolase|nr:hypothetical protein [Puniceicoccales bacterium]
MKKVLLFVWSVCIFLGAVASGSNLEINIFSVGVGNFVLLRKDDNVLVIDCGKAGAFRTSQAKTRLENILERCISCTVVVTHDHKDHYSAAHVLDQCFQTVCKGGISFFYGWSPSAEERKKEVKHGGVRYVPLCDNPGALDRCLGRDVSIHYIVPEANVVGAAPHVNNLVIGIRYGNTSFIFPGDATQDWYSENCEKLKTLINQLGGVDFLLIPHHGSMSDTGFFMKGAIENFTPPTFTHPNNTKRLMCVISSVPERKYRMPRQGVQYLFSPFCCTLKVKPHCLSLAQVNPNNTREWNPVIEKNMIAPVFSTVDTFYGYKIVSNETNLWMYEELGIPRHPGEGIAELKVFDSAGLIVRR